MARSRVIDRPFAAVLALLGLSGVVARAETNRAPEKIVLEAAPPVDIDTRNNRARLREVVITQGDVRIEAAEAQVVGGLDFANFDNGEWTMTGNVRIRAEGGSLRSDKAVVQIRNNLISMATITGAPAEFEQQRKDGTVSRGHARVISYEPSSGTVRLREDAWLSSGCSELKGDQLVYNIKTQRFEGQPLATPGAGGRITITIQPKGESGSPNPCAKPGTGPKP